MSQWDKEGFFRRNIYYNTSLEEYLSADNDGIFDIAESVGANMDLNNNGLVDNFLDTNMDGAHEPLLGNPLPHIDSDGDGVVDSQDLDSDNDGISDNMENLFLTDSNGDGKVEGNVNSNGVPIGCNFGSY